MKRIAVVPRSRIGRGVESPLPQSDRIDDGRVSFPVSDGITLECQIDILRMRASVGRDDAEEVHVLVQENDDTGELQNLCCIRSEYFARMSVRQALRRRIIVQNIAR